MITIGHFITLGIGLELACNGDSRKIIMSFISIWRLPLSSSVVVPFAAVIRLVTQRSWERSVAWRNAPEREALRDDPNNGCKGDYLSCKLHVVLVQYRDSKKKVGALSWYTVIEVTNLVRLRYQGHLAEFEYGKKSYIWVIDQAWGQDGWVYYRVHSKKK